MNTPTQVRVAITGGIGSGKSAFAQIIEGKGFPVIKADELAKHLMSTHKSIKTRIIKSFGKESYSGDSLNTEHIAKIVFPDPEKTKILNSIVHPIVINEIKKMLDKEPSPLVFCEAALIFEARMTPLFDYIVLITAEEPLRIQRVVDRDKVTPESVLLRMQNQMSEIEKNKRSHYIFENNGTLKELESKANLLITLLNPRKA